MSGMLSESPLTLRIPNNLIFSNHIPANVITFNNHENKEVARITADGVLQVRVDPTDAAALEFIRCIEKCLVARLTGIEVIE